MLKSIPLDIFKSTRFILLHTGKSEFQFKNSQETAGTVIISENRINIYTKSIQYVLISF